jgi:HAD superfamily hydrolase (TIGR01509 family)
MTKTNYPLPSRKNFPKYFHLSLMDAIKVFTKSKDEKEIKRIWNIGKGRRIKYDLNLLRYADNLSEVIKELSKKYLLGIVTNRQKEAVFEAPELEKLRKYFKVVVCYQDTINHKPHPEPLILAAEKLGVKPEESVYIGDVKNDIKAGKAAGMKVIIYSKKQFNNADAHTTLFNKLPEIIKSL